MYRRNKVYGSHASWSVFRFDHWEIETIRREWSEEDRLRRVNRREKEDKRSGGGRDQWWETVNQKCLKKKSSVSSLIGKLYLSILAVLYIFLRTFYSPLLASLFFSLENIKIIYLFTYIFISSSKRCCLSYLGSEWESGTKTDK